MSSDTSEIAWMQHEIGYCHLTLHEPIEALQCGISAFENAEAADDVEWQINSCVLIAQAYRKHFISHFPFGSKDSQISLTPSRDAERPEASVGNVQPSIFLERTIG